MTAKAVPQTGRQRMMHRKEHTRQSMNVQTSACPSLLNAELLSSPQIPGSLQLQECN